MNIFNVFFKRNKIIGKWVIVSMKRQPEKVNPDNDYQHTDNPVENFTTDSCFFLDLLSQRSPPTELIMIRGMESPTA